MRRFERKRAIVTGGAKGIGRAVVTRLALEGATQLVTDVARSAVEATCRQIEEQTGATLYSLAADVSS